MMNSLEPNLKGDTLVPQPSGHFSPTPSRSPYHRRAVIILIFAMVLWGVSFPLMKATLAIQSFYYPQASTLFLSIVGIVFRFGFSAIVMGLLSFRALKSLTKLELIQGIGLGLFACGATLFQFDGLNYTAASTSAFLTNCYVVLIPVFVALQNKRWPSLLVQIACLLVLIGMGVLANLDFHRFHLGRGETETIISSLFFGALILWLERPCFRKNKTQNATFVMYTLMTLLGLPLLWITSHLKSPTAALSLAWDACVAPGAFPLLMALAIFCTLCAFTLMNYWQPHVEATEAGLIYCAEPVFGSCFALFLPQILSNITGNVIHYSNEQLTLRLIIGGALITLANITMQLRGNVHETLPL